MNHYDYYAGIDWGQEHHQACLIDAQGQQIANRSFEHGGRGLQHLSEWLEHKAGTTEVAVGIEVPHGPVVETLMERQFKVHSINPKQLDRFRDRISPAGAKDDRRDAYVLAISLRSDGHRFRHLQPSGAEIIELRELTRIADELTTDRTRRTNRIRQSLWRYYPQFLELERDLSKAWVRELWQLAPTPESACRLRETTVSELLKQHRVRRISAKEILERLCKPAISVTAGTEQAVCTRLQISFDQLELNQQQLHRIKRRMDQLIQQLSEPTENEAGINWQRDVAILSSIPGVGRVVLATLLAEAPDALQQRNLQALRCLCGVAPVTRRSGKSCIVVRRLACNRRLQNSIYHWARTATQHDPISKAKYNTLRARGHSHARALRSIGDRMLTVAYVMLTAQKPFNYEARKPRKSA